MRRYRYGGSGIVDMIGSLLARYATKAMLTTAANTTMRGTLDAAKRAAPHLNAHKVDSTIAADAKSRYRQKKHFQVGSQIPTLMQLLIMEDLIHDRDT